MNLVKVQGHDNLFRNSETGAVVSVDKDEYEAFINQYKSRIQLEHRVTNLENKLDKILELLSKE